MNHTTPTITYDTNSKKLTVRGASIFPEEVFDYADKLEILDMSVGHLQDLPTDIGRLTGLRIAFFSNHDFSSMPDLSGCQNLEMVGFKSCKISQIDDTTLPKGLRGLILTDNSLESLPASIGRLRRLQKLMLSGNHLRSLPHELLSCQNLELLRLAANELIASPNWLAELPSLAWYSDAGNPFCDTTAARDILEIQWSNLKIGEKLGESAKNQVFRAEGARGEAVAVKLFGSDLSTDGLIADEIRAMLQAGGLSHCIGAIGKLVGAPDGQQGLVMPLVQSQYRSVGLPPDFYSLTRDVYPVDARFAEEQVRKILQGVATAFAHLHASGVMHGDLYAHNLLADQAGDAYVGDFGAASLYAPGQMDAAWREKIDVRGFGHLAEELARLSSHDPLITQIGADCLATSHEKIPTFSKIVALLNA